MVHTSINGCHFVGRVAVGNKRGLLVPSTATDQELQHLRNALPESIVIQRIEVTHTEPDSLFIALLLLLPSRVVVSS